VRDVFIVIVHCVAVLAANRLHDGALPPDYFPHSQIVGGFSFNGSYPRIGHDAARAANWTSNSGGGIVYHISGGFESAQCITSQIDQATKTVVFDATQGCDQVIIPHRETFRTTIQPPYSSAKGWIT
jgi:hypothetical protein